jgi:ribA/ribD-fused uncharacterized protein
MAILFYRVKDEYGCFSNFAPYGFMVEGTWWPTSEHYFQAAKFSDEALAKKIRLAPSPMIAVALGRDKAYPLRTDWNTIKDDIMREAVRQKFMQNHEIAVILLSTGNEALVEATSDDYYWGCGAEGTGANVLGKILMEVREELAFAQGAP